MLLINEVLMKQARFIPQLTNIKLKYEFTAEKRLLEFADTNSELQ